MNIIPKANGLSEVLSTSYRLPSSYISIDLGSFDKICIQAFLDRANLQREIKAANEIVLQLESGYKSEEYKLRVSKEGIMIKAATENAVISALTTLYQIMDKDGNVTCCNIHDKPRYVHRGLSFDCVRHFFPVQEVKRIIEQMALVKMNVLHWHLSDDQGWRIESKRYPKLHQQHGNDYFSQDEIKDIVAYANTRGIEVIPEVDMPGHVSALLAAYPQYSCSGKAVNLATCGGIFPVILCAGNEDTYVLIDNLLDEICSLFTSKRFHIGGDEAPKKEWVKCPRCQAKIKEENLANEIELQGYFSNCVMDMLKQKGKAAICWNDSLEAKDFNANATIQYWTVNHAEPMEPFINKGGKFIFSDMFTYYLDYPYSMTPLKRVYEDPQCIGDTDCSDNPSLLGVEACIWAEHLKDSESLEKRLFPRLYAAAEVMWSNMRDYENFESRLIAFLKKCHPTDMGVTAENEWNPQGEQRRQESFGYLASLTGAMSPDVHAETIESAMPNEMFQRKMAEKFFDPSDLPILMKMMQGE